MSPKEQADYASKVAITAIARWGGRPELYLKENPEMNFRNPPKKGNPAE